MSSKSKWTPEHKNETLRHEKGRPKANRKETSVYKKTEELYPGKQNF